MSWIQTQIQRKDGVPINPLPPISPLLSPPHSSSSPPIPLQNNNKISPAILFIIIILSAIFFISALLHLIVKFLIRHSSSSSQDFSGTEALQRQLHQLFTLHDSGLDQSFIDALPVFLYKEISGPKEGCDCAVCLCEFSEDDQLRLLPLCSHAFHIDCIDKWLLSNSTCPLCRGSLLTSTDVSVEQPVFQTNDPRQEENGLIEDVENGFSSGQKPVEIEVVGGETRVFPVRLGRFRRVNNEGETPTGAAATAESSSNNMDARRCYSMGSLEYVVGDSSLQVGVVGRGAGNGDLKQLVKGTAGERGGSGRMFSSSNEDVEGKRLNSRSKGESFSVSKIWLWSKKDNRLQSSSSHNFL